MFDSLSDRLDGIFSRLRNRGRLTERDIEMLRERIEALLARISREELSGLLETMPPIEQQRITARLVVKDIQAESARQEVASLLGSLRVSSRHPAQLEVIT